MSRSKTASSGVVMEDALDYVDHVKVIFKDEPSIYNAFLEILDKYQRGIFDTVEVIKRISILFFGFPKLVREFGDFVPNGLTIEYGLDTLQQAAKDLKSSRPNSISHHNLEKLSDLVGMREFGYTNRLGSMIWVRGKEDGLWRNLDDVVEGLKTNKERFDKPPSHREREEALRRPGRSGWAGETASHLEQIGDRWFEIEDKERKRMVGA